FRPDKEGPMLFDLLPSLPEWDEEAAGGQVDGCHLYDSRKLPQLPDDEPPLHSEASADAIDGAVDERAAWETAQQALRASAREELAVHPATKDEGDDPIPAALAGADDQPLIAGGGESPPRRKGEALHKALELVDLHTPQQLEQIV